MARERLKCAGAILHIFSRLKNRSRRTRLRNLLLVLQIIRKRRMYAISSLINLIEVLRRKQKNPKERRIWVLPRPQFWFNRMITDPVYDYDLYWKQHFRFSRETIDFIVQLVRGSMEKRNTRFRLTVPIEKRVAVALWWLSSGNSFRTMASTFGQLGKSTAIQMIHEFVDSLCELCEDLDPIS